jgi:hypothetical protein
VFAGGFAAPGEWPKVHVTVPAMGVNSTHPDYDASALDWSRARDVLSGEDAVKAAGEKYLPRLDSQTDDEFAAYRKRASFFNATARTAEGYVGLMFRRPPFVKVPEVRAGLAITGVGRALADFLNDADMLGSTLGAYAKNVVWEVMGVGRAGSLVDWEDQVEKRAYVSLYGAEQIINWQIGRVNGRNVPTLVVLRETVCRWETGPGSDEFVPELVEQIRVLRLVAGEAPANAGGKREYHCEVELWQPKVGKKDLAVGQRQKGAKVEWELVDLRIPLRLGKPLPLIPFVFHGPRHSRPDVDRLPLSDIVAVNLDHYRLDADFKHGLHFTALPTAWVSGFDKTSTLRIGSSTAWVAETPGATAGFLEFTGQGLTTFERAMDRDERLMAVLGSRLLEDQKKVGETAQAIELRQSGENSVLSGVATSVSESLTQILRWVYWWNSTEEVPDSITSGEVLIKINTDFSTKGMDSQELQAIVAAWQSGAFSRDTMFELFRKGEILPDGRTNQDEEALIRAGLAECVPHGPSAAQQVGQQQHQQSRQQQQAA